MKKLIFSLCTLIGAATTQTYAIDLQNQVKDLAIEMAQHKKQCKQDWLTYARQRTDAKFKLLEKHHAQRYDLEIEALKTMPEDKNEKAGFWLEQLKKGLALKERQLAEWENFGKEQAEAARKLTEKDEAAIRTFKQKLESTAGKTAAAESDE